MARPEITIAIPVYNEEKTLLDILERVGRLKIKNFELIVVDDASKDASPAIIKDFFKKHPSIKHQVITHATNKGKGAGIKSALMHATGAYFVVQDADLEYDPADVVSLLNEAKSKKARVMYGSRFLGNISNMPRPNYYANISYNLLLRVLYGVKMTDMHTCYKMVETDLMKELHMAADGFDYATELVSKLLQRKEKIHEYPISFHGRTKKEGKKINVMDGVECLYKLLAYRVVPTDDLFRRSGSTTARFLLVGVVGFLTNYATLVILTELFRMHYVLSEAIAAFVALQVTFILHDNWTYRLHMKKGEERLRGVSRYISFITSNALGSIVTVVVFGVLHQFLIRSIALLLAAFAGLIWNYLANKYITWRPKN